MSLDDEQEASQVSKLLKLNTDSHDHDQDDEEVTDLFGDGLDQGGVVVGLLAVLSGLEETRGAVLVTSEVKAA